MISVSDLFNQSEKQMPVIANKAEDGFKKIVQMLETKGIDNLSEEETRYLSKSHLYLFIISKLSNYHEAESAILCFEKIIEKGNLDADSADSYITALELTYQLEKAHTTLLQILSQNDLRKIALKHLSSYAYCADGMQSVDECIHYNEELESITDDLEELRQLRTNISMLKGE